MDPLNTNQNPIMAGNQMPSPETPKSSAGPVAGAAIIIILLIAGGLYFWGMKLNEKMAEQPSYIPDDGAMQETMPEDQIMEDGTLMDASADASVGLPPQSTSDDAASIQADLNAMDMGAIENANASELNNI